MYAMAEAILNHVFQERNIHSNLARKIYQRFSDGAFLPHHISTSAISTTLKRAMCASYAYDHNNNDNLHSISIVWQTA